MSLHAKKCIIYAHIHACVLVTFSHDSALSKYEFRNICLLHHFEYQFNILPNDHSHPTLIVMRADHLKLLNQTYGSCREMCFLLQ